MRKFNAIDFTALFMHFRMRPLALLRKRSACICFIFSSFWLIFCFGYTGRLSWIRDASSYRIIVSQAYL